MFIPALSTAGPGWLVCVCLTADCQQSGDYKRQRTILFELKSFHGVSPSDDELAEARPLG
jgi:hypothetical protein